MPQPINLLDISGGTVTAPAGCGKTYSIASAVSQSSAAKPILILTHTNAGVAALRRRLDDHGANPKKYRLTTIDGWVIRLIKMFPARSEFDPDILLLQTPRTDYPAIRDAAHRLFVGQHIQELLAATFSRIIVDEYQDCGGRQHELIKEVTNALPICVLGDPLQAIFDFAGPLPDWDNDVCATFPVAGELDIPWRWNNVGEQAFGEWLRDVRRRFLGGTAIDLQAAPSNVSWVHLDGRQDHARRLTACKTRAPNSDGTVLIIGDSRSPNTHHQFAGQTPGATVVENVDLRDLVEFAGRLDLASPTALEQIINFAQSIMTNVGATEYMARIERLRRGSARRLASAAEQAGIDFLTTPSYTAVRRVLSEFSQQAGTRSHRPAILRGCMNALQMVGASNENFADMAIRVREQSRVLGRPVMRRSVGSTLLLKGLEADVAVVLTADALNKRNMYVAMTRGSRRLVMCSATNILCPQ